MEQVKLGSFSCPQCQGAIDVLDSEFVGQVQLDHRDCEHTTVLVSTLNREQIEDTYLEAELSLYNSIKELPAEHVRNLLEVMLVGIFDVGILESLSDEQAQGITIWLKDLAYAAGGGQGLDLSQRAVPGANY